MADLIPGQGTLKEKHFIDVAFKMPPLVATIPVG